MAAMISGYSRRLPVSVLPPQDLSLALGAVAIHRSGPEAALFQPALDLVFGEADVRFDPRVRDQSLLHVRINRLAVQSATALRGLWRSASRAKPRSLRALARYGPSRTSERRSRLQRAAPQVVPWREASRRIAFPDFERSINQEPLFAEPLWLPGLFVAPVVVIQSASLLDRNSSSPDESQRRPQFFSVMFLGCLQRSRQAFLVQREADKVAAQTLRKSNFRVDLIEIEFRDFPPDMANPLQRGFFYFWGLYSLLRFV